MKQTKFLLPVKFPIITFISSSCEEKYTKVRKKLAKSLEETTLFSTYCFENEAASSEPMPEAYLHKVDDSCLFILLVDNKDGVREAVASELARAKQNDLRILAFFCTENSSEETPCEKELINHKNCKIKRVDRFSKMPDIAFNSAMEDVASAYRKHPLDREDKKGSPLILKEYLMPEISLERKLIGSFTGTHGTFNENFNWEKNTSTSKIDILFQNFFPIVLSSLPFDEKTFPELIKEVSSCHQDPISGIVALRLAALQQYFLANLPECEKILNEAKEKAKSEKAVPQWIIGDIGVDLRYVIAMEDQMANRFSLNNPGQQTIDENTEALFFPFIDRLSSNLLNDIVKAYAPSEKSWPYTISFSNNQYFFDQVTSYYCSALLYGSITHLNQVKEYLADLLESLNQKEYRHRFFAEEIKMLLLLGKDETIKNLLRSNPYKDMLNSSDIDAILLSISNLPIPYQRDEARLNLFAFFGYYYSNKTFESESAWLGQFALSWSSDPQRIIGFSNDLKEAYKGCALRLGSTPVATFTAVLLSSNSGRLEEDACDLFPYFRISELPHSLQNQLAAYLSLLVVDKERSHWSGLSFALILFLKNATIDCTTLKNAIQEAKPDFYNNDLKLELTPNNELDETQVLHFIQDIDQRNETAKKRQGRIIFADNLYAALRSFVWMKDTKIKNDVFLQARKVAYETILIENESNKTKCEAVYLLIALYLAFPKNFGWEEFANSLSANSAELYSGEQSPFEIERSDSLHFFLKTLFLFLGKEKEESYLWEMARIPEMETVDEIEITHLLANALEKQALPHFPANVLPALSETMILLCQNRDCDIAKYAFRSLIQLTAGPYQEAAIRALTEQMDKAPFEAKYALIQHAEDIHSDNQVKEWILEKGVADSHFLIRSMAKKKLDAMSQKKAS